MVTACALPTFAQGDRTNGQPATVLSEDVEVKYTRDIEGRTAAILQLLVPLDAVKSNHVHDAIMAQYRALRTWHDANDDALKKLGKAGESGKAELGKVQASLKEVHNKFIAKLSEDLTPEQVEKVKDKMVYNKVQVTYNAYCQQYPTLNDEQKAKILEWLKEAREEAMDGGSSKEKSDIFNRYKGKINNYLSKQGLSTGKPKKEAEAKPKGDGE